MRKWVYCVVVGPEAFGDGNLEWHTNPTLAAWLNEMGDQGWELIKLDTGDGKGLKGMLAKSRWVGIFKRQAGEVERV